MSLYRGPSEIGTSQDTTHAMVLAATSAAINAAHSADIAKDAAENAAENAAEAAATFIGPSVAQAAGSAAVAVAAEIALTNKNRGLLATAPTARPDGSANQPGDYYFSTVSTPSGLTLTFNGATWQASDVNTANLAGPGGAALLGFQAKGSNAQVTTLEEKGRQIISICDFGGVDDWNGTTGTNNYVPFLRIYNDYPDGVTVRLPKLGTGVYMSNGAQYAAPKDGYVFVLDEGVSIHNMGGSIPVFAAGVKVTKRLEMRHTTTQITADYGSQDYKLAQDKTGFMTADDGEAPALGAVSHLFASQYACAWPNGPVVASVPSVNSSDTTTWAANASGFNLTTYALRPGSEIGAYLADNATSGFAYAGNWLAGVVTDAGFAVVRQDVGGGNLTISIKSGVAAIAEQTVSPPTVPSLTYRFAKGLISLRVHTPTSFSVLCNGIEVAKVRDAGGMILSAGFGPGFAQNANPAMVSGLFITRHAKAMGVQPVKIVIVGDSITDPAMGCSWADYMRQYIAGVGGVQCLDIKNIAIAGDNSAMQLSRLTATSIVGYDYCCVQIGVNDVQGAGTVAALISNIDAMRSYCNTNACRLIVGVPTMWYGQTEAATAGNLGGATSNKEMGSPYRVTLLRYLSTSNIPVNLNTLSDYGAIIPSLLNQPGLDSIVYDNVHPTTYGRMLLGFAWAKALIGQLIPRVNKTIDVRPMPLSWCNGTAGATARPQYSVRNDVFSLSAHLSTVDSVQVADNTLLFTLPEIYRPLAGFAFVVPTAVWTGSPAGTCILSVSQDGTVRPFGVPVNTAYIYSGAVSFPIAQ
jgi:lysophospholipase L1-like esterase